MRLLLAATVTTFACIGILLLAVWAVSLAFRANRTPDLRKRRPGVSPPSITCDPLGRFVLTADGNIRGTVTSYSIDSTTSTLIEAPGVTDRRNGAEPGRRNEATFRW